MTSKGFYFFKYDHSERDFIFIDSDEIAEFDEIVLGNLSLIPRKLTAMGYDALLILDNNSQSWYIGYSETLGIVGERTSRRQADSIVRSGVTLPDGYWLKEPYPLKELSDPNLGDLWKTVQSKFLTGDLTGLELDEETGIPTQIKERAERLKKMGHEDALTEAKFEFEEAENRKKAMARDKKSKKAKAKKVSAKKTPVKKAKAKKVSAKKTPVKKAKVTKPVTKKTTAEKGAKQSPIIKPATIKPKTIEKGPSTTKKQVQKTIKTIYMEISSISEFVKDGNTQIICKGSISKGLKKVDGVVTFTQDKLSVKEWNEIAVFLSEDDVIEITTDIEDEITYALSLKI